MPPIYLPCPRAVGFKKRTHLKSPAAKRFLIFLTRYKMFGGPEVATYTGYHANRRPAKDRYKTGNYERSMTTKQAVIDMIQRLPEDVTVEDIMSELYFRQKVDEGLRQLDAGEGVDHEEAKKRLSRWLS